MKMLILYILQYILLLWIHSSHIPPNPGNKLKIKLRVFMFWMRSNAFSVLFLFLLKTGDVF